MTLDQIGLILGAVLTLLIGSYLIGDNFLYRLATYVLVGVGAAYITVTVIADVLLPRMLQPVFDWLTRHTLMAGPEIIAVTGLLLSLLLLLKIWPRWAGVGNIPVGYLVGVGAAVALGGALFGTLGAQALATTQPPRSALDFVVVFGTVTTLASFSFQRAARRGILSGINWIGRFFLSIALGATFALVYVASVTLLVDRLQSVVDVALSLLGIKQ
jgi:hypothetical protein